MLTENGRPGNVPIPISVITPVRNEAHNLSRCLESLRGFGEVFVIDSRSTDPTVEIANSYDAKVVQFHYPGGWPKKRQSAMDTLPLAHDWILLLDADEAVTTELADEMNQAIQNGEINGYYIELQMYFLGRMLRHSGARLEKLSLLRRGKGHFECRLRHQDTSMCDMEVHEHVVVGGRTAKLKHPLMHHNVESLSRYIHKHDGYSNWEARVWVDGQTDTELRPSLTGRHSAGVGCGNNYSNFQVRRFCFFVQVHPMPRVSGWRAGAYLLRDSGNTIFSYQSEGL